MAKITWNPESDREVVSARKAFAIYDQAGFVAKGPKGITITTFDWKLGSLTFEPRRTAWERLTEDDPV